MENNAMPQLEEIRRRLLDRRLYQVASATGLTYQGIRNIVTGKTKNPSYQTLTTLMGYLDANR